MWRSFLASFVVEERGPLGDEGVDGRSVGRGLDWPWSCFSGAGLSACVHPIGHETRSAIRQSKVRRMGNLGYSSRTVCRKRPVFSIPPAASATPSCPTEACPETAHCPLIPFIPSL